MTTAVYLNGIILLEIGSVILFRKGDIFTVSESGKEGDYEVKAAYMDVAKKHWKVILKEA